MATLFEGSLDPHSRAPSIRSTADGASRTGHLPRARRLERLRELDEAVLAEQSQTPWLEPLHTRNERYRLHRGTKPTHHPRIFTHALRPFRRAEWRVGDQISRYLRDDLMLLETA